MKSKRFWMFYTITALIFVLLAIIPVKEFVKMCLNMKHAMTTRWGLPYFTDSTIVIPFMAVILAVLIGFLIIPIISKMPLKRARICVSVFASILFIGIELAAEHFTAINNLIDPVMKTRMIPSRTELFTLKDAIGIQTIPPAVRIHYYIFSIILILIILNFLYSLSPLFLKNTSEKTNKRFILLQGLTVVLYTLSYVFVQAIQFENINYRGWYILTLGSVFNANICIALASMSVGLFSGSFIKFEGLKRYIPSALTALTTLALYGAEYIMLGGKLYSYGTHFLLTELPVIRLSVTHLIVILLPTVIVFFTLKFSAGLRGNAKDSLLS